jgi:hypothetical protein
MNYESLLIRVGLIFNGNYKKNTWISCSTIDKPGRKKGSYFITDEGFILWKNWRTGEHGAISEYGLRVNKKVIYKKIEEKTLPPLILKFMRCTSHDYLERKKCVLTDNLMINYDNLVIPMYDFDGNVMSYQSINKDGGKLFAKGRPTKGLFHLLSNNSDSKTVFITEGYATGNAVYQCSKYDTYVSFSASNILNVYNKLSKFGCRPIVVCDNDPVGTDLSNSLLSVIIGNKGEDFNDVFIRVGKCQATALLLDHVKLLG